MEQPTEKIYTYADLLALGDDVRAELIDGELYMMAPPSRIHQKISFELSRQIGNFLVDKPCEAYSAPFGVRLFQDDDESLNNSKDWVEPDIVVVCDHSKLIDAGCKGAPDLIIEILSPSNIGHDRLVKFNLYQRAGVREYWIVDPLNCSVEVCLLNEEKRLLLTEVYSKKDIAKVNVLPGCEIDLSKVFPEEEP